MKIRAGFVSNSSSSSFIVISPRDYKYYETEDFKNEFGEYAKDVAGLYENAFFSRSQSVAGADINLYRGNSDCEGCWDILDNSLFEDLCEKMNLDDDARYEFADKLYNVFASYFKNSDSLIFWDEY